VFFTLTTPRRRSILIWHKVKIIARWLAQLPKPEVAKLLSPQLKHADILTNRLAVALKQDGDITANVEKALNEHSAEFFPYVGPVTVKTIAEDDETFAHAEGTSILIHGNLLRNAEGAVELSSRTVQAGGEAGLAADLGHEYNHVEQTEFLRFARGNRELTEGQYQRGIRLAMSIANDSQVELVSLNAENNYYALRAVNFVGKKSMVKANAISPANFASFYQKVMSTPIDEMPPSFKAFVDKQNALRSSISPAPTDHDMGRQFFIVLRGQIASARSHALMSYKVYENLYHETEAFQLEGAIKGRYGTVSDANVKS
jgi:hypothetical protein